MFFTRAQNLKIACAKFAHNLTAHSARGAHRCDFAAHSADHGNRIKFTLAVLQRFKESHPFGTYGRGVCGILYIAAGVNRAVFARAAPTLKREYGAYALFIAPCAKSTKSESFILIFSILTRS